jgi:hypothetical protein
MPLALMGFTLQSVPPQSSTVLLSRLVSTWFTCRSPTRMVRSTFRKTHSPLLGKTARFYCPDGQCDPTNKLPAGVNPLKGPFTSCAGVTRCRRPILSWVVVPFRECRRMIPTRRLSSRVLLWPCKQNHVALQSIENQPVGIAPEGTIHPL